MSAFEILMVVLTGAYVTVAFFQWRAIRRTNKISERSLDAIDSPLLLLKRIEVPNFVAPLLQHEIQLEVENRGKDIALDVRRATTSAVFYPNEYHRQPDEADLRLVRGQAHLPEGSSLTWKVLLRVNQAELEAIRNKSVNVGVLGYLVYDDRLGREHHLRFQRFLDYNPGGSFWLYGPARDERDGMPALNGTAKQIRDGERITIVNSPTTDVEER